MERRAYTRQPLAVEAQAVRAGVGAWPCVIRDFCPGGVFVSFAGEHRASVPVDTDESVQIRFAVVGHGEREEYSLRARVAGVFKGGAGCEFFDADPKAVRMLQHLANKARQGSAETTGEQAPWRPAVATATTRHPEADRLLGELRAEVAAFLEPELEALFKEAGESLFAAARDAPSNAEQTRYLDALKDVDALKAAARTGFYEAILRELERLEHPLEASEEPAESVEGNEEPSGGSELSLVESGEFSDWLTVKKIYSKAEPRYEELTWQLRERLSHLVGTRIEDEHQPIGLAALCHTFHDAMESVAAARAAREAAFAAFEKTLVAHLGPFYEAINQRLIDAGLLPKLERPKPQVPRHGPAASGDPGYRAAPPGGAPEPGSTWGATRPSGAWGQAAGPGQTSPPGAAGPGGRWPATPPPSWPDERPDERPDEWPDPAIEPEAPLPPDPRGTVAGHVYSEPLEISRDAYRTAQTLLALQRRLAPAMQALAEVGAEAGAEVGPEAGSGAPPGAGAAPAAGPLPPTYAPEQVLGALALLARQTAPASADEQTPDLGTRVLRALRSRHGYAEKRAIDEPQANAIEVVGNLVRAMLDDALVSDALKARLRRLEVPVLAAALRDANFFSAPDHPARKVINRIGRLAAPGETLDPATAEAVDPLIERIVESAADDPEVFGEVSQALDELVERQAAERERNVREVVQACERQQALLRARSGGRPAEPERELPEEWKQWLARGKRLRVGDPVILDKDTDHPRRVALAWVDEDHSTYVFVDGGGKKAATLSLPELAMALRRGSADVVPESQLSVMDRALYGMLERLHEQVVHRATHDQLTELANRKELEARLEEAAAGARREGARHVLLLIDMDHFHVINERCGKRAGDRLLKEIGRVLLRSVGRRGVPARLGEDKFGVLLEGAPRERGFELADRQRQAIERFRVAWRGERLPLTASIGLVEVGPSSGGARDLLAAAAAARDAAKEAGGNRIEVHRPDRGRLSAEEAEARWRERIERALAEDRLELRCQKIAPLSDDARERPHYEILLGVRGDAGETLLPGEFIQAAELYGRIGAVDRWVIEHAFRWMADNKRTLARVGGCSINLSAPSLSDEELLEFVLEQFSLTKLPPGKVLFEVTESSAIQSLSNAENFIRVMKEYGCRFSLDDFGSGHSSYSYLKHLPVDFVKIDGMFVRDIAENPSDYAMVQSINEIGHFMGKRTVAEFAESEEVIARLREIGVDYAQGYAIEVPRPLREIG